MAFLVKLVMSVNVISYRVKELGADENGVSTPMGDDELMLPPGSEEDEEADLSLIYSRNVSETLTLTISHDSFCSCGFVNKQAFHVTSKKE